MSTNRIHNVWDSLPDAELKAAIVAGERKKATLARSALGEARVRVSFQVLTHVVPAEGRATYQHTTLFVGSLPIMVVHTVKVASG